MQTCSLQWSAVLFLSVLVSGLESAVRTSGDEKKPKDLILRNRGLTFRNPALRQRNPHIRLRIRDPSLRNHDLAIQNRDLTLRNPHLTLRNPHLTLRNEQREIPHTRLVSESIPELVKILSSGQLQVSQDARIREDRRDPTSTSHHLTKELPAASLTSGVRGEGREVKVRPRRSFASFRSEFRCCYYDVFCARGCRRRHRHGRDVRQAELSRNRGPIPAELFGLVSF